MLIRALIIDTARRVGSCLMGAVILWQVAERAGRVDGEAVIHVCEPNAAVLVDGYEYPLDPVPRTPIVCPLRPGSHILSMRRDGRVLYQETFTIEPGGQVVLTALDQTRPVASHQDPTVVEPSPKRSAGNLSRHPAFHR